MSGQTYKILLPVFAVLALTTACENMYLRPLALPTGYTYQNDAYKSPPSPEADDIGYTYSAEKNAQILESLRVKAEELFAQLEGKNSFAGEQIYVFNAHDANPQGRAFETALRDVLRKKGYTVGDKHSATRALGFTISETDRLQNDVDFGDFNKEHRELPIFKSYGDYEQMVVGLSLMEGEQVIDTVAAVYSVPMYGYDRDGGRLYFLGPVVGKPLYTKDAPAYRPAMNRALDVQHMEEKKERRRAAQDSYDGNAPQKLFNQ